MFNRHFHLPQLPDDVDVFALAMELGDRVYARSMQLHEPMTPRMAAYQGLYVAPYLPKRAQAVAQ